MERRERRGTLGEVAGRKGQTRGGSVKEGTCEKKGGREGFRGRRGRLHAVGNKSNETSDGRWDIGKSGTGTREVLKWPHKLLLPVASGSVTGYIPSLAPNAKCLHNPDTVSVKHIINLRL